MSKRIGEALVAKGLLSASELDEALQMQLISGGHLGTSLIDLGFVDEVTLGETLAELHRLRYASRERVAGLQPEVIGLLPQPLAEKYRAVPLGLEDRTLHVAVVDPRGLSALSSSTGYKIVPWIVPEVRLYEALETYYGIPRRPRYLRLCKELDSKLERSAAKPAPAVAAVHAAAHAAPADRAPAPDIEEILGDCYGKDWRVVARELGDDLGAASPEETERGEHPRPERRRASARPVTKAPVRRLDDLLERMCRADHKEELSEAVLDYVAGAGTTVILFSVRSLLARIWDARGVRLSTERMGKLAWPVTSGSIFTLLLGNSHYRGAVPAEPSQKLFFQALGQELPAEIYLQPIYLNDRLVAILYADGGPTRPIPHKSETFKLLADKLSLALSTLILKMKIRAV